VRTAIGYADHVADVEPFIEWLQAKGLTDPAHLAAYRRFVAELAEHPSLSAALRAAEEAGKPPREIANLRQVAARLAEFEEARNPTAPRTASPSRSPVAQRTPSPSGSPVAATTDQDSPPLEVEPRKPSPSVAPAAAAALAIEARPARPTGSSLTRDMEAKRRGCICNRRGDVYLDDDFGALARLFGGGIGIGTIVLIRMIGVLGALTIALGAAGMGGLVTITSICMRCEGCRRRIQDPTDEERARIRKGRGRVVLLTLAFVVGAAICGAAWWSLMKKRNMEQYGSLPPAEVVAS